MDKAELIRSLYQAFSEAPRPESAELTPHRCLECDEARDRLAPHEAAAVPDEDMEWLGDSLALLGPEALRYYLPRFLEHSLNHPESNACDVVLFHLAAEDPGEEYWAERYGVFSAEERRAIVRYLRFRSSWPESADVDGEWLERGLRFWSS